MAPTRMEPEPMAREVGTERVEVTAGWAEPAWPGVAVASITGQRTRQGDLAERLPAREALVDEAEGIAAGVVTVDDALDFANARLSALNAGLDDHLAQRRERIHAMTSTEQRIDRTLKETEVRLARLVGTR